METPDTVVKIEIERKHARYYEVLVIRANGVRVMYPAENLGDAMMIAKSWMEDGIGQAS